MIPNAIKDSALTGQYDELDFSQANELVKSRQRYFRRPKRPADILSRLMARKGYAQTETANELEDTWNQVAGEKWKSKTKVGIVRAGVLEILVCNSSANQQLGFQKKKILTELQQKLPKNNLKDLRFTIGNIN
ncbi:MAG: hypothetical protein ACI87E_000439 [Mariniblastus sp.]|jgi:hypothetical protein